MSKSTRSDFDDETALGQSCPLSSRRHTPNAILGIIVSGFGKTARAVRDFVTCSSSQSNGFSSTEDVTPNPSSQEDVTPNPSSQDDVQEATPSTASTSHVPSDDAVRDVFSDFHDAGLRDPGHCHRNIPHEQAAANSEPDLWASSTEVATTSDCGPKLPSDFFELSTKQRLRAVKQFLSGFAYKPNSETSLQANKQRPLCRIMATARRIVYKPEPIKSVEAVFLALYLTAGLLSVDRVPVSFKTKYMDEVSQHTVLLVQWNGKYGAFGISPNPDLMTKNRHFDSMSSVIESYLKSYEASAHSVLKIRIGLPVEHDLLSTQFISWRYLCVSPNTKSWVECVVEIENHALRMRQLWDLWVLTGKGDDPRQKAGLAKRKVNPANCVQQRGKKTLKNPGVGASEVTKQPVERSPAQAPTLPGAWDAESTGSNADEEQCEHCEQLTRSMPPSDTKRATLTTVTRIKTSDTKFTPKNKALSGQSSEQQWEAESFESNTGDSCTPKPAVRSKPKLNPKQIVQHFVSSSVLSTPSRRLTRHKADAKLQDGRVKRKNPGPLYNFAFSGTKSKAG